MDGVQFAAHEGLFDMESVSFSSNLPVTSQLRDVSNARQSKAGGILVQRAIPCPLRQAASSGIAPAHWRKVPCFSIHSLRKNLLRANQRPDTTRQGDMMVSKMETLSLSSGSVWSRGGDTHSSDNDNS